MRWLAFTALAFGCADEQPPATPGPPPGTDPAAFGVTDTCAVGAKPNKGGFGPWYDAAGAHYLVHGDDPEEAAFAAQVLGWYQDSVPGLALRAASALTDEERAQNLFLVGSAASLPVLDALDGALPVRFRGDTFAFGGYLWEEPGHGIALVHPSPFAEGRFVLLHVGNTRGGAWSTFSVPTGTADFAVVRGGWTLQQEGHLCRDTDRWLFYEAYADDLRADWDAWVDSLETTSSEAHTYWFEAGSEFDANSDWMPSWQEERTADILRMLEVAPLDHPIATYLYSTRDDKARYTGSSGNAHANAMNFEVHELYGDGVHAVGAHEDVHVFAWHQIGDANGALLGEGLAVWVDGGWLGQSLDEFTAAQRDAGTLPPLQELIDDFWGYDDALTYGIAGHFVGYLEGSYGIDVVKALYVAPDLAQAFEGELGLTVAEVEAGWLASIP